jgi:hypothetical protein
MRKPNTLVRNSQYDFPIWFLIFRQLHAAQTVFEYLNSMGRESFVEGGVSSQVSSTNNKKDALGGILPSSSTTKDLDESRYGYYDDDFEGGKGPLKVGRTSVCALLAVLNFMFICAFAHSMLFVCSLTHYVMMGGSWSMLQKYTTWLTMPSERIGLPMLSCCTMPLLPSLRSSAYCTYAFVFRAFFHSSYSFTLLLLATLALVRVNRQMASLKLKRWGWSLATM